MAGLDFTPHTDEDVQRMLATLGLEAIEDLFAHLPDAARVAGELDLPSGRSELEVMDRLRELAARDRDDLVCFAGAGYYDHHVPPVVRALQGRPEFVTSYTPYQPEVSQGVLQALWEYQSMVCAITGMEVANASLYDGATAVMEAVNLAVGATGRDEVWISRALNPRYRETVATLARSRGIRIVEHPVVDGTTVWQRPEGAEPAAVIFAQPNYLGAVESYDDAVGLAHDLGALAVASVDPMTLGLLRAPGEAGVDIVVGEGQPLGNPLSFGGPVCGLFATTRALVRRIPGRLVGRTVDQEGRTAYVMTLRAREQDIRRAKATSNICTNQSLNAIAVGFHLAWLGPDGLATVGDRCMQKAHYLARRLAQIPDVRVAMSAPFVREFPIVTPLPGPAVIEAMADRGYLAGVALEDDYPELAGGLLVAVTERRTKAELDGYADALEEVLRHGG